MYVSAKILISSYLAVIFFTKSASYSALGEGSSAFFAEGRSSVYLSSFVGSAFESIRTYFTMSLSSSKEMRIDSVIRVLNQTV